MENASRLRPAAGMRLDRRLLRLLPAVRSQLALLIILSLLTGLVISRAAWLLSQAVSRAFLEGQNQGQLEPQLLLLVGLALLRAGLVYWRGASASRLSAAIRRRLRDQLLAKLTELGPAFSRRRQTGELTAAVIDGVDALDPYFRSYLPQLASVALIPLVLLATVFPLDPLSGWVLLLTAPLIPFFMVLIGRSANRQMRARWVELQSMSGQFLERLQGLATLKMLGSSARQFERIRQVSDRFRRSTLSVLRIAFLSALVLEWIATLSTAIVAVQIGLRLLSGQLTFQVGFFILLLAPEYYLPMRRLGTYFHASVSGLAAADPIFELLEAQTTVNHGQAQRSLAQISSAPLIEFDQVGFQYPDRNQPALHQLNFKLAPGELTALVGPSGAGKTTILHLLLRFMDPQDGVIRVNGRPLSECRPEIWRQSIAWVPQQPFLLTGTLLENLQLGNPEADLNQIDWAVDQVGLTHFIQSLAGGFQTPVGERGLRLSGGQARRLALARAFLRRAPLLLLDEPTGDLDPATEESILESMRRLKQKRTTLWISHRLNTTLEADQVLLLAEGRIVEAGTPSKLLAAGGSYRQLTTAFLGGKRG